MKIVSASFLVGAAAFQRLGDQNAVLRAEVETQAVTINLLTSQNVLETEDGFGGCTKCCTHSQSRAELCGNEMRGCMWKGWAQVSDRKVCLAYGNFTAESDFFDMVDAYKVANGRTTLRYDNPQLLGEYQTANALHWSQGNDPWPNPSANDVMSLREKFITCRAKVIQMLTDCAGLCQICPRSDSQCVTQKAGDCKEGVCCA